MFKKITRITSIIVTSSVLAACNNGTSTPDPTAAAPAQGQKIVTPKSNPISVKKEKTPYEAGKKVFTRCRACHTNGQGERNLVGPNLYGLFGRTSGTQEEFAYSKAMTQAKIVWNEDTLDEFLHKPLTYIPKTKMAFVGLSKEQDRQNVIIYLKKETGAQ